MENNENAELNLENNEEIEEADIYADLENNIENAKNQINQVNQIKNQKYEEQENQQELQDEQENENENLYEEEQDQNNNNEDDEDDRLTYTLITLDLGDLIHIFEENNISFVDMLLLSKEDLKELQLKLYQRNRIHNFSILFSKYAKNYSISEISDFFSFNPKFIFNSSIYDRVILSQNQNDIWESNNINNENINDNNENDEVSDENNENDENNDDKNINVNNNQEREKYDLDNINYNDYMNFMNSENEKNSQTMYNAQKTKQINDRLEKNINNKNTNYNDIKYNTFNNNNYNNNYYLSSDWNEKNKIKQEQNNLENNITTIKNTKKNKPPIKPSTNPKINNNTKISNNKHNNKKEQPFVQANKLINQPKEPKAKIIVNKKPIQSQNILNNINNQNLNDNSNNINTSKISSTKKKSSNRLNAVINKYLELKQDTDEFLEKLNKKKTDSQNKYNKYNLLIKKKNLITKINDPNNLNILNSYKNIPMDLSKKKVMPKNINKQLMQYNKEFDLNDDINIEYQKMNNQIEELEKINLDLNSKNHLNQIKKYISEKGDSINLDDISKINSELIKMIEIIDKKEKLKKTLENYNLKIEQNRQLLNELNELDDNEPNDINENLEERMNENYENQINYNNFNNNNINNNLYLDEVEEEFENEMPNKKNKKI